MIDGKILWITNLMAATTVGAGLFALPFVFAQAGWALGLLYVAGLAFALGFAHQLYLKTLKETEYRHGLLGLIQRFYGQVGRRVALIVVLGGLLLTLLAYLILSRQFLFLIFPGREDIGPLAFWLLASLPVVFGLRRMLAAEAVGGAAMILIGLWIFAKGMLIHQFQAPAWIWTGFFLPFGPVLFALSGWTAVGPSAEFSKKRGLSFRETRLGLGLGTAGAALFYLLFVAGILGSGGAATPDTIQGLGGWLPLELALVAILGLFAIWTSYIPIGIEIKKSCETDLGWSRTWSTLFVFFIPPALYLLGFNDFLKVIGLVGGVFMASIYVMILMVSEKVLPFSPARRRGIWLLSALFILAAVYEVYYFIVG